MKPEYEEFLTELCEAKRQHYIESRRDLLTRADLVRAECNGFTKRFAERFPHLKRVAGFYCHPQNAKGETPGTEHWWCVEPDGTIVDPTAEQFDGHGVYVPLDKTYHHVRLGRCMNCGDDIYGLASQGPKCICSKECENAMESEYYHSRPL